MNCSKKVVFLLLILTLCSFAFAAPKATLATNPRLWTLDVSFEHPKQITVQLPGYEKSMRYWYVVVTLTNLSNQDVDFYPQIELMTDTFKTVEAGKCVTRYVYDRIKLANQGKYPFLQPLDELENRVLQGKDNAIDVAIILPEFDPDSKNINIFISGLSNETVAVDHPTKKDKEGKPVKLLLRKTLELNYAVPGDKTYRDLQKLEYKAKRWIMR